MARPLRLERAGAWYHLTSRGGGRGAIFCDGRDRAYFCELLEEMCDRFRLRVHAYVLMPDHYHLLVETAEANLSRAAQWLNLSYSIRFNLRHRRRGKILHGRFKSVVLDRDEWALPVSRYLHLNPVRVGPPLKGIPAAGASPGVVRNRLARLRKHRWSSYPAYAGLTASPSWLWCDDLLRLVGGPISQRRRRYRSYVEATLREGSVQRPWDQVKRQVFLGGPDFARRMSKPQMSTTRRAAGWHNHPRPAFKAVVACVEKLKGAKWREFRNRYGDNGRDLVLHLARQEGGMKLGELARKTGMQKDAVVSVTLNRYRARLKQNPSEQALVARARKMLEAAR